MGKHWGEYLRRGRQTSPAQLWRWLGRRLGRRLERTRGPRRAAALTADRLLALLDAESLDALWRRLGDSPFPGTVRPVAPAVVERFCPGAGTDIAAKADAAANRRVDLLGSGPIDLPRPIDWQRDFKSGHAWTLKPSADIDVNDLGRNSDVKVPWDLSRLQWLLALGQAYLIEGDDARAKAARDVIEEWIAANPPGRGVNWTVAMEAALRAIALIWLFHACNGARAWRDEKFRFEFLRVLYLHGDFIRRHLEWSDVNANHLLADAAGLVALGLFFGNRREPAEWHRTGWKILAEEMPKQVGADGATFEASSAYHRLATELFLVPATIRLAHGLDVPTDYRTRLAAMARFAAAYARPDDTAPNWGDADDGRVLPFGRQRIADHRYLVGLVGLALDDAALIAETRGPADEAFWLLGPEAAARLSDTPPAPRSTAFEDSSVYAMAGGGDHVFIDAGPVGMKGRGGHGHNDCLSFEAVLDGVPLIVDSGAYVYTASVEWRNRFRSTAAHNTPMVDGQEQNRIVRPEYLWTLMDDARPTVRLWQTGAREDRLVGEHAGYRRLADPVTPIRAVTLDKERHRLIVIDRFECRGTHRIAIPFHLHPDVAVDANEPGIFRLTAAGRAFVFAWHGDNWKAALRPSWWSPSYGIKRESTAIEFAFEGKPAPLACAILSAESAPGDLGAWLAGLLNEPTP